MGATWERTLFKVCLYGIVAAQAFLVYIAWGEWNVPDWMRFDVLGLVFTLPQAAGFCFVGVEAWALVVKDLAEARGHKVKAGWLVALFAFFFALNGVMDWTGWYSVFGGDQSTRSEAVHTYQLDYAEYTDDLAEANATIAQIAGTAEAPRAGAPRGERVIRADLNSQDSLDRRWREQQGSDLPRNYVDTRARLDAEMEERIALNAARTAQQSARKSLRDLGAAPEGDSDALNAINGLIRPAGVQIGDQELNSFYSFALMLGMKLCIGIGFWASSFQEAGGARRRDKRLPVFARVREMAVSAVGGLRQRIAFRPVDEPEPEPLALPEPKPEPAPRAKVVPIRAPRGSLKDMRARFGKP